jgi:nicotinamide mononucleotide transporter PnuC
MSQIEIVAAIFGFLCVALYIARSDWSWPTGFVQVLLYISVFWQAKLYADMILHCVYVVLQIYGWWAWASARRTDVSQPTIRPRQLGLRGHVLCLAITAVQTLLFAFMLSRWTDAQSPYADSFVASASLVGAVPAGMEVHRELGLLVSRQHRRRLSFRQSWTCSHGDSVRFVLGNGHCRFLELVRSHASTSDAASL